MGSLEAEFADVQIDAALERAKEFAGFPRIVEAAYYAGPGLECLSLRLNDGRRLLIPSEELSELAGASNEEARDVMILPQGRGIWWPKLDDGLYLPDFLGHRWGRVPGVEDEIAA